MIYITGDTHGEFKHRFSVEAFPEQREMTKDDYVIICGDFGGVWDVGQESKNEKWWLDRFEEKNYTTLFIDGNHENFDRLYDYPVEEWMGGKVHKIRPSVIHLMRGQVFSIDGKKIFTFGGAKSHDIGDGILNPEDSDFKEKKKALKKRKAIFRIAHESWWEQELASEGEMAEGVENLAKHSNKVDYIITHCASTSSQRLIRSGRELLPDVQTEYLEKIKNITEYKKWFFGHYHSNQNVSDQELLLYEQLIRI